MTDARPLGVVLDTMVISWLLDEQPNPVADGYRALIDARPVVLAFQTVMELRYGALRAGWGELRRRRLEGRIAELVIAQPDDEMISVCAELRLRCQQGGHALGSKIHDGDRWIASTSIRLGLPLASHDTVFSAAPGLELLTVAPEA
jgi:predicted nucleic acid-binding protein